MVGGFRGALANARHEAFCLLIVRGKSQGEAYQEAGYKPQRKLTAEVSANRLLRQVSIRRRINELQRYAAESVEVTAATLIQEAATVQRDAMRAGNHAAAMTAIQAKAKLAGLWVERSENTNLDLHYTICDTLPTEAQWEAERIERLPDASRDMPSQAIEKKTP